ncbi:MAG: 4Fe-4S dicluster domain-containing protein [Desulfobacteraceae bacterium]|nr:4Fe-4S dicluster domain-containing protein [Desulfobacteraceae bacterium]
MLRPCIQCGTCTASCPNTFAMDRTPRKLWRLVQAGMIDEVFKSKTFILCSSCYYCTLRCPRGLPLTRAMGLLTQVAQTQNPKPFKKSHRFYQEFIQSVRRHGRVNEAEFMSLFFLSMKSPILPFEYASLGMRLMQKKKVSIPNLNIWKKDRNSLEKIFNKIKELEEQA